MIDPRWMVEDLDPRTWRAIGHLFSPIQYVAAAQPGEHGLFVLHDGGSRPRIVDTLRGARFDLGMTQVQHPRRLANQLFESGEWDRVHVIDRQHLERATRSVSSATPRESVDAHYHRVFQAVWDGSEGYVAVPPHPGHWHGWTYSALRSFLQRAPSPSSLGLVVLSNDRSVVEIGLVAHVIDARLCRVTTLEGVPPLPPPSIDESFMSAFAQSLAAPAAVLVCTRAAFDAWVYTEGDKSQILREAVARGEAILHNAL